MLKFSITLNTFLLSLEEIHFKVIYFLSIEIILVEGFNASIQYTFFNKGKSFDENIIFSTILMNVLCNRLVCIISSSSRNKARLKCFALTA